MKPKSLVALCLPVAVIAIAMVVTGRRRKREDPPARASGPVKQVTYNGHPLYYYVGDHAPGSTNAQQLKEFGALWYVLAPSGSAITSTVPSNPTPAPAAPTSSCGY